MQKCSERVRVHVLYVLHCWIDCETSEILKYMNGWNKYREWTNTKNERMNDASPKKCILVTNILDRFRKHRHLLWKTNVFWNQPFHNHRLFFFAMMKICCFLKPNITQPNLSCRIKLFNETIATKQRTWYIHVGKPLLDVPKLENAVCCSFLAIFLFSSLGAARATGRTKLATGLPIPVENSNGNSTLYQTIEMFRIWFWNEYC